MNSRERLLTALSHKEPDRIPLDLGAGCSCKFTKYFYVKLLDYFGIQEELVMNHIPYQLVTASDKVLDLLKCDVRSASLHPIPQAENPYAKKWEDADSYYYTNNWGTRYRMPKHQGLYYDLIGGVLQDSEDEEGDQKFIWPVPEKFPAADRQQLEDYRRAGLATTISEQFGNGFLQQGPLMWGFENWFAMLLTEPERCTLFMDKLLEKKKEYYDHIFEVYGGLVDVCSEADDFGTQRGTFVSPKLIREMILPYHKKLNDYLKAKGAGYMTLHSCGSVEASIPDIIEAGFDCLNPVQISAANMSPEHLKKTYGKDITFWGGGINTQSTLPNGTPEQVREETKRNIDAFARDGGFVFATVHNVQDDVPIENFIAMWETFQDHCKY
ncbi:Uroporphyrinogen-III decarboxylase-like protein [Desulfitobacterium hafniense DCB-2]|uniref:Uroporphyrinogen-III decarboxylase-like protein n=1 Tax=Desulfitobacterium hafniense (strain DSM 10664 / DCB-2) TaxID=272564 RepID=B8FXP1_DESHD|nr:uroporphyrinogen decarboxylase family protein [Desulfitobacterium hafniense]ACL22642.1 Uroporphyrinogen-III decarboxylase-like protein [Desulfitobacterium hafniense DCB-2]